MSIQLYDYQQRAVEFAMNHPQPLLVAPTGAGKSVIAWALMHRLVAEGWTVIYAAHLKNLILQFSERLTSGYQLRIGNARAYNGSKLVLSPVQSLASWRELLGLLRSRKCVIIWDEWHESFFWDGLAGRLRGARVKHIGLTGTPWRLDGAESWAGPFQVCEVATYSGLVAQGKLLPIEYRCLVPKPASDRRHREFTAAEKRAAIRQYTPPVTYDHWVANGGTDSTATIGFVPSVAKANEMAEFWRESGTTAAALTNETPDKARRDMIGDFKAGRLTALFSPHVLEIGFDAPNAVIGLNLNHTAALDLLHQRIGRLSRLCPDIGKTQGLWLDFTGNCLLFDGMLPEQITSWTEVEQPQGKGCDSCGYVNKRNAKQCLACGHKFPRSKVKREFKDGSPTKVQSKDFTVRLYPPTETSDPVDCLRHGLAVAFAQGQPPSHAIGTVKAMHGGTMPQIPTGALIGSVFMEPTSGAMTAYREYLTRVGETRNPDFYMRLEFGSRSSC